MLQSLIHLTNERAAKVTVGLQKLMQVNVGIQGDTFMSKPIVVITNHYMPEIESRIEVSYTTRRNPDSTPLSPEKLLQMSDGADAIFVNSFDRLDATFFDRVSSSVKVIATYSAGYEHIDIEAAAKKSISIAHTPGINSNATADVTMLLLLGAARRRTKHRP